MVTRARTYAIHPCDPALDTRANHVCRWASHGSRAFTSVQRKPVYTPPRPCNDERPLIWFGGDGLKAGFTVSNVGSILAGSPGRQSVTGYTLSFYRRKLRSISILKACEILAKLGCADDTFYRVCHDPASKRYTRCTPAKVAEQEGWYKGCGWLCAALVSATKLTTIEFLGGPPSRWGVQRGSLFTLLMDRITVMILLGGAEADSDLHLEDYITNGA